MKWSRPPSCRTVSRAVPASRQATLNLASASGPTDSSSVELAGWDCDSVRCETTHGAPSMLLALLLTIRRVSSSDAAGRCRLK